METLARCWGPAVPVPVLIIQEGAMAFRRARISDGGALCSASDPQRLMQRREANAIILGPQVSKHLRVIKPLLLVRFQQYQYHRIDKESRQKPCAEVMYPRCASDSAERVASADSQKPESEQTAGRNERRGQQRE